MQEALRASWTYETAYESLYVEGNPAAGQRYPTARVVAKYRPMTTIVKGRVWTATGMETHFWNVVADDFLHIGEVLKDVLAAVGYKAYEIGSYKVLIALAAAAGASGDIAVLEQSLQEEQEMGDWLGSHIPVFVTAYVAQQHTS